MGRILRLKNIESFIALQKNSKNQSSGSYFTPLSLICLQFFFQAEVCSGTVAEVIQSVVNGADGCIFCFGHVKLGELPNSLQLITMSVW